MVNIGQLRLLCFFFFQAEDGIRDWSVTGVQTCALPICRIEWNVTARTGEPHVRIDLAERVLVTWIALDVSASMSFGTADRRKADVAEGVALALGHVASRRGNRLGLT